VTSYSVVRACHPRGKCGRKGVGLNRLHFASWNVGILTRKSIELVQALHRRKVNIACIQETKWVGSRPVKSMVINCGTPVVQELEMEFYLS